MDQPRVEAIDRLGLVVARELLAREAELVLAAMLSLPVRAGAEVIRSFTTEIRIEDPATLRITETIVMDFEQTPRRGIFRVIPVRYDRYRNVYTIDVRIESVQDETGSSRPYKASRQGDSLSIRIGDPEVWVTGQHTYVISYTARRAMNFFSGEPEDMVFALPKELRVQLVD